MKEEPKKTEQEKAPAQKTSDAPAPGFVPARLHPLGGGVWVYQHEEGRPDVLPDKFWEDAKLSYGMKAGDCVIFVALQAKKAILVVV